MRRWSETECQAGQAASFLAFERRLRDLPLTSTRRAASTTKLLVVGTDVVGGGMAEARLLLSACRYEDARRLAYACSAQNPGDPAPLLLAARAEMALGDGRQAERTASHAVGLDPASAEGRADPVVGIADAAEGPRHLPGGGLGTAELALDLAPCSADVDSGRVFRRHPHLTGTGPAPDAAPAEDNSSGKDGRTVVADCFRCWRAAAHRRST